MGAVKILPTKECSKCGKRKTYEHFYLKNFKPNGWCKDCYKARHDLKMRERQDNFMMQTPSNISRLYQAPAPHPAPKPSGKRTAILLDNAEVADLSRRDAKLFLEEIKLQDRIANIRNERRKLWFEIANGSDLDGISVESCSLCGLESCVCKD